MFSLVIPTYNRAPILKRMLTHLLKLDGIGGCEVVVVNDGSSDDSAAVLAQCQHAFPGILRVLTLPNGGPARARNRGVQAAKHERLLFVDDDVFPRPGMLQSHARLLDEGYTGSQGILVWHEDIQVSPLIRYIDSRGSQFAFDQVKNPRQLEFAHVYTGNFAVLKSAVLEAGGFDERLFNPNVAVAAFEDTILGYSLLRNGAKLALNPEAIADHLHAMTEDDYFQREYKVGYTIARVRQMYPEVARTLGWDRKDFLAEPQARLLAAVNSARFLKRVFGYRLSMRLRNREAFYRGFAQFKREAAAGTP
jgi:glycosyltransferase involved in cell wall biosynthesis